MTCHRQVTYYISLLIDSLIAQKDAIRRQIADAALCIYCSNVRLNDNDRRELLKTMCAGNEKNRCRVIYGVV